ncbi:5-formyltetrahydrofolate cyclo-ligase [Kiritimatiellota bacterium B12222]|nr:5-formyltetrahydrofolate cyclo-ligase [Kiritimatiellota bacterium B12222]
MKTKAEYRQQLKAAIDALSDAEKERQSRHLCERLLNAPQLQAANRIGIYLPLPDEPDLRPALSEFLRQGKQLALPFPQNNRWHFHNITSLQGPASGPWNLTTPLAGKRIETTTLEVILVPGRGFTLQGQRIGRGKGIYDQLLQHHAHSRIGMGFNCQKCKELPSETHDILMTEIYVAH